MTPNPGLQALVEVTEHQVFLPVSMLFTSQHLLRKPVSASRGLIEAEGELQGLLLPPNESSAPHFYGITRNAQHPPEAFAPRAANQDDVPPSGWGYATDDEQITLLERGTHIDAGDPDPIEGPAMSHQSTDGQDEYQQQT